MNNDSGPCIDHDMKVYHLNKTDCQSKFSESHHRECNCCCNCCRIPVPFVLGNKYCKGQFVTYNDLLYFVNVNCPQGYPGSSTDFITISTTGPTGATGAQGPAGPPGAAYTPSNLVTNTSAQQTVAANTPIVFNRNVAVVGSDITHTEDTAQIALQTQGLYLLYYDGTISALEIEGTTYPINATIAVYQDGRLLPASSTTVQINQADTPVEINGYATIRVGTTSPTPSIITIRANTNFIIWNYVETVVGKTI